MISAVPERFDPLGPLDERLLALEASAGTGKTYNITTIFLRLVVEPSWTCAEPGGEPIAPERILVVTFTRAATAQMRERIRSRLRSALDAMERAARDPDWDPEGPGDESERWRREFDSDGVYRKLIREARETGSVERAARRIRVALEGFDEITISTIHGFCERMLRQFAFESGTGFDSRLAEDLGPFLDDIATDCWVRSTWDLAPDLLASLRRLVNQEQLRKLAEAVAGAPDAKIFPEIEDFDDRRQDAWRRRIADLKTAWDRDGETLVRFLDENSGSLNQRLFNKAELPEKALAFANWLDQATRTGIDTFKRGKSTDDPNYACRYFAASRIVSAVKKDALKKGPFPPVPSVAEAIDRLLEGLDGQAANERALAMRVRRRVIEAVRNTLPRRMAETHVMGFDNLLRDLRDAMRRPGAGTALRDAISRRYSVAIIDEFQDTDPVQWEIFRELFGPGQSGRFVIIGDPKQAIYGFRHADVEAYLEACRTFTRADGRIRSLDVNWRADGPLVEALNVLYGDRLPDGFAWPGIRYQKVRWPETHDQAPWRNIEHRTDWSAPLRLAFIDRPARQEAPLERQDAEALAVRFSAIDILEFLTSGNRIDRKHQKDDPVRPGDIAVIVRTHDQGRRMARALHRLGIPCVRHGQETVFQTGEAADLKSLLEAIVNPADRGALRTALATRLLGADAATIAGLEIDDSAIETWRLRLESWSNVWKKSGFTRMFRRILALADQNGLTAMERILALPDGERRMTNYLHLAELLHDAGRSLANPQESVLAWLRDRRAGARDDNDSESRLIRLESDDQAVRIVTGHACKGLEYPFVWVPFLWYRFRSGDILRFHLPDPKAPDRLRIGLDVAPDLDKPRGNEDPEGQFAQRAEHRAKADAEAFAEDLRLAYVALTRARHGCTFVSLAAKGLADSSVGWLLHQEPGVDPDLSLADRRRLLADRLSGRADDALSGDLHAIAAASQGRIVAIRRPHISRLPDTRWTDPGRGAAALEPETFTRTDLDRFWTRASFSGMSKKTADSTTATPETAGEVHDAETRETDDIQHAPVMPATAASPTGPLPDVDFPDCVVDLDRYPSGKKAGNFIHKVLEILDFRGANRETIGAVIRDLTPSWGMREPWIDRKTGAEVSLANAIDRVLTTPLGVDGSEERDLSLACLERQHTLREAEFHLPVLGGFDARSGGHCILPHDISRVFESSDAEVARAYLPFARQLRFGQFRGFLTGGIDLVFRWSPDPTSDPRTWKWYLVDYKSNRLVSDREKGSRWADYGRTGMLAEMAHANYVLQYHLYLVALHRFLRQRLPGYDYDRHIGGVFYLFLRGMQGRNGKGDTGVFRDRPPASDIERLSRIFDGREK